MQITLANIATELAARLDGPLHFRLFLQPIMAAIFAFRDGRIDAKKGGTPFGWAIFTEPEHRRFLIQEGWKGVSKVFILAIVLDFIYQFIALKSFNPLNAIIVGILLAIIPYVALRGIANRLTKRRRRKQ
ncbi:MAG: hypothetical protein DCF20_06180 [Pseudanabaena sp.]|nr:MAG: hypothetical protein DCF20_06180 [Pseudanabaena sp.]